MTPFMIAFFMAAGASAWVFDKTQQRTGHNTAASTKVSVVTGIFVFAITLMVLSMVGTYLD